MPLSSVSNAVYDYFIAGQEAGSLPNLGTIYQAIPKVANESDLFSAETYPGQATGAVRIQARHQACSTSQTT